MTEQKKKRKRDEIDYHDPNQRLHPPPNANIAGSQYVSPSKPIICHICEKKDFEWGYLTNDKAHYGSTSREGISKIKVRRCLNCNNLQLFSEK